MIKLSLEHVCVMEHMCYREPTCLVGKHLCPFIFVKGDISCPVPMIYFIGGPAMSSLVDGNLVVLSSCGVVRRSPQVRG